MASVNRCGLSSGGSGAFIWRIKLALTALTSYLIAGVGLLLTSLVRGRLLVLALPVSVFAWMVLLGTLRAEETEPEGAPADSALAPGDSSPPEDSAPVTSSAGAAEGLPDAAGDEISKYQARPAAPLPQLAAGPVVVIPIEGTVELGMAAFVERAIAASSEAALVILDVNTFGGRVDAAVKIRDALLSASVPTLAFVNRRAISAGALISLATDHIVFTSGASLGAATPVQVAEGQVAAVGEKMTSYMRSEMRATAEAKGRDGDLAEAMVDASVSVPGVSKAGKLLTLSTELAVETGVAVAEIDTLDALLVALGRTDSQLTRFESNWAESVVRVLTEPTLSGLLMSIGTAALLIDVYTAGFGLTGILGLSCLGLFFGGHYLVGLAGWEEMLLFLVGLGAIAVEVFVIPGFGVAGLIGITALLASLTMSMLDMSLWASWETGLLTPALTIVTLALVGVVVLVALGFWLLGARVKGGSWLVLRTTLSKGHAGVGAHASTDSQVRGEPLLGLEGEALTDLRLSGKARIDGQLQDVVSQMEYIDSGARVRVVEVEGPRIVVAEVISHTDREE